MASSLLSDEYHLHHYPSLSRRQEQEGYHHLFAQGTYEMNSSTSFQEQGLPSDVDAYQRQQIQIQLQLQHQHQHQLQELPPHVPATVRSFTPSVFSMYEPRVITVAPQQPQPVFLSPMTTSSSTFMAQGPEADQEAPADALMYPPSNDFVSYQPPHSNVDVSSFPIAKPSADNSTITSISASPSISAQTNNRGQDPQLHQPVPTSAQFVFPAMWTFPNGQVQTQPPLPQPVAPSLSADSSNIPDSEYCGAGSLDPISGVFSRAEPPTRIRTAKACEKCRIRKAKCSGETPACGRCTLRGLKCEYSTEGRIRGPNKLSSRNNSLADVSTVESRRKTSETTFSSSSPGTTSSEEDIAASRRQSIADFRLHPIRSVPAHAGSVMSVASGPQTIAQRRMSRPSSLSVMTDTTTTFNSTSPARSSPLRMSTTLSSTSTQEGETRDNTGEVRAPMDVSMSASAPALPTTYQAAALLEPSMFVENTPTRDRSSFSVDPSMNPLVTGSEDYVQYVHSLLRPQLERLRMNSYGSGASGRSSFASTFSDSSIEFPYEFGTGHANVAQTLYPPPQSGSSSSGSTSPITPAFDPAMSGQHHVATVDDVFLPAPQTDEDDQWFKHAEQDAAESDLSLVLGDWIKTPNQDGNGYLAMDYSHPR